MESTKTRISAIIICKNEAATISACITSIRDYVDEVVVVDSGSTDGTLEMINGLGLTPVHHAFEGFGAQKKFACSLARNRWVFSIDADEITSSALGNELSIFQDQGKIAAYRIPRRFRFLGKTFQHGHGSIDYPTRLFRTDLCSYDEQLVHESVVVKGLIGNFNNEMLHESYTSLSQYLRKFDLYTSLGAQHLVKAEKHRNVIVCGLLIPLYFIKQYLFWGHFLNGVHGFIWSILSSIHPFVKVAKAWAIEKR